MPRSRTMYYHDRLEAGQQLAARLMVYAHRPDVLVLALPRGGVPVAFAVAAALAAPLDVFLVRKLGVPEHEELAMGAIATGGVRVLNKEVVRGLHISDTAINAVAAIEQHELERRERLYRRGRPGLEIRDHTVILVDDGLATGATMRAAALAIRQQHPARIVAAVPVAARAPCEELRAQVNDIVCVMTPEPFYGVGQWYDDFTPTSDDQVCDLLARAAQRQAATAQGGHGEARQGEKHA